MTIKVTVVQPTKIRTSINTQSPTITNKIAASVSVLRLDQLLDVEEQSPADGSTLVYNSQTDVYEVKKLDIDDLTGDINDVDGGSF